MDALTKINNMELTQFIETFGGIFENSPWIAQKAAHARPFVSVEHLYETMRQIIIDSDNDLKRTLILEHPQLGKRIAMSTHSVNEQTGAGLTNLTAEQFEQLSLLNDLYVKRFHFPFIIAVAGLSVTQIIVELKRRLALNIETEFDTALHEIYKIAYIRFSAIIEQFTMQKEVL